MEGVSIALRFVLASGVVLVLAYLAARYARTRWTNLGRGEHLEVLEAVPVGARQHLALVRVGSKVVCVAVTAERIAPVTELADADGETLVAARREAEPADAWQLPAFARRFYDAWRRQRQALAHGDDGRA